MSEWVRIRWYGMDLFGTFGVRQDGTGLRQVRTKEIGHPFPATPGYSLVYIKYIRSVAEKSTRNRTIGRNRSISRLLQENIDSIKRNKYPGEGLGEVSHAVVGLFRSLREVLWSA